ncbi:hypothetical protein SAMN05444671_3882 [Flavobacterium sp. CF108]|jgi:hypothetical protein|uniref:DUF5977 domain-containing protein n=1 Tax=unclassified Flavobacterium TaxID=196869 RepID=UPI0008ACDFC0|nr:MULTISPECIES: DUF5977 domain-containing protein [unclassified Flavobacterium]SEO96038.1 hypothetical protein SAMN04487978_4089 [Flavobacterium sp. fv08]SHH81744.1 hypothetical protein SAMN05444671_3882 [Flavobacterium sp. CF108]
MANTGYKSFTLLERYYKDDGSSTGDTKPNVVTDPDYIAPFLDTTNCPPSARYYNTEQTKTVTKNSCAVGEAGTEITLTAYTNQFVSDISITDANNQAIAWLEENAQVYANNLGTCILNTPIISSSLSSDGMTINLSWIVPHDDVKITGYQLYRTLDLNGDWLPYRSINIPDLKSFSDTSLAANTTYYYKVVTRSDAGLSTPSNVTYQTTGDSSAGGPGGGGSCFVEGTLITLPDGSKKAIEELHLEQLLLSAEIETLIDTNNASELYKWSSDSLLERRITSPITKLTQKDAYKTIIVNDGLLEATPTHLQLIQRDGLWRFISLGDIQVGDNLYSINNEIIPVTSVKINLEKRRIFPLTLNPFHTYFANGILTHNYKEGEGNSNP